MASDVELISAGDRRRPPLVDGQRAARLAEAVGSAFQKHEES